MKTFTFLFAVAGLWLAPLVARADALDDLITGLRSGAITGVDPDKRKAILDAANAEASETYRQGLVALYLWQIKASIADGEHHGGWPYRSFIIMDQYMRKALTAGLTKQFDEAPDSILAYALLCPALYAQDDALFARADTYLKENDAFLRQMQEENLEKYWRPWVKNVLDKEAAAKAAQAK